MSHTIAGLTVARAVIGAGVCACLMAPLKAIAAWYPPERQASYSGWIMVSGGAGALMATVYCAVGVLLVAGCYAALVRRYGRALS